MTSPIITEAVRALLASMGATHVMAAPDHKAEGSMSIAADIVFWEFLDKYTLDKRKFEIVLVSRIPFIPPAGVL